MSVALSRTAWHRLAVGPGVVLAEVDRQLSAEIDAVLQQQAGTWWDGKSTGQDLSR
jgi:hypothetical protein